MSQVYTSIIKPVIANNIYLFIYFLFIYFLLFIYLFTFYLFI